MSYELRIFIPRYKEGSAQLMFNQNLGSLVMNITLLINGGVSQQNKSITWENRDDSYIVTNKHYCGVKFRNNNKLELKVKEPYDNQKKSQSIMSSYHIEKWNKYKVSNKDISQCKIQIENCVAANCFDKDNNNFTVDFSIPKIDIRKQRISKVINNVNIELCLISVMNVDSLICKDWISICIESNSYEYIINLIKLKDYRFICEIPLTQYLTLKDESMNISPLIGGYPHWINYISSINNNTNQSSVDFNKNTIESSLRNFISNLN